MQANKDAFTRILNSANKRKNTEDAVAAVLSKLIFCPFCNEYFTDSPALSEHIKSAHAGYLTSKAVTVNAHEVSEGAEIIYICPHCHFAVDNYCASPTSTMTTHIDSHSISIVPNTKMAFQISNDRELIDTYINGRVKADIYLCPICSSILSSKEALLRHLYLNHSDSNGKNVSAETIKLIEACAEELPKRNTVKRKYGSRYSF
jgi:uncharacterized C2H2 Zn-finger protein